MTIEWAALAKAAAPVAQQIVTLSGNKLLLAYKVAARASKSARMQGVRVKSRSMLREKLRGGAILAALASGDEAKQAAVQTDLESLIEGPAGAAVLLEEILAAYVHVLDLKQSVRLQLATHQQGQSHTSQELTALLDGVVARSEVPDIFPAVLQDLAIRCRETWAPFGRAVRDLELADDRPGLLSSWAETCPAWLSSAPGQVHCVLGELADSLSNGSSGAVLLARGLRAGVDEHAYWAARHTMMTVDPEDLSASLGSGNTHPLARALVLNAAGDNSKALIALTEWVPRTDSQHSLRANFRSQLFRGLNRTDEALAASLEGWEVYGSISCAKLACEQLLVRGSARRTQANITDLERALETAIQARDRVRIWTGPSGAPVALAASAAQLLGDFDLALNLVTQAPGGTATAQEAAHHRVAETRAHLHAEVGDVAEATSLIEHLDNPRALAEVRALLALRGGDDVAAAKYLREAIDRSETATQLLQNCSLLAFLGETHERASEIPTDGMDIANELTLVAKAASGDQLAIDQLGARARTDPFITLAFIRVCKAQRLTERAARQAVYAGETWTDANYWMIAADLFRELGQIDESIHAAEQALRVSRARWGRKSQALVLLIELHSSRQNWQEACHHSATLVASNPAHPI